MDCMSSGGRGPSRLGEEKLSGVDERSRATYLGDALSSEVFQLSVDFKRTVFELTGLKPIEHSVNYCLYLDKILV